MSYKKKMGTALLSICAFSLPNCAADGGAVPFPKCIWFDYRIEAEAELGWDATCGEERKIEGYGMGYTGGDEPLRITGTFVRGRAEGYGSIKKLIPGWEEWEFRGAFKGGYPESGECASRHGFVNKCEYDRKAKRFNVELQ